MTIFLTELLDYSKKLKRLGSLKRHHLYPNLVEFTSFLPEDCAVSRRLWHVENGLEIPKCKVCQENAAWDKSGKYRTYCSNKCAKSDPDHFKKIQTTNMHKYGSRSPFGSKEIQDNIRDNIQQKYGVDNISKLEAIRKQKSKHSIKVKNVHISKYDDIDQMINKGSTQWDIGKELGITQPRVSNLLHILNLKTIRKEVSSDHQEIIDYIKSLSDLNVIINDRNTIAPYELDIFVPDLKLAIEVNGIFWHSELSGRDKKYHINKTLLCQQNDIKLIHIFGSEWQTKKEIIKSRLSHALNQNKQVIFARKCVVRHISSHEANSLVELSHLQGIRNASLNIGLFYYDSLVAMMSFSSHKKYQYELVRSCTIPNTSVIGGMGKIFNYFVRMHDPLCVLSYADRRWGSGEVYESIGFQFEGYTPPNYWYFKRNGDTNRLYSRLNFQKHKLPKILPVFDPDLSEWQNMVNNGYDRIWDCGSVRWIWQPKKGT